MSKIKQLVAVFGRCGKRLSYCSVRADTTCFFEGEAPLLTASVAAGSESTVVSVLTGVLETSSNYHCVAEFAGGTTVPKQNIPQNKP